jgi:hypothetical protein
MPQAADRRSEGGKSGGRPREKRLRRCEKRDSGGAPRLGEQATGRKGVDHGNGVIFRDADSKQGACIATSSP